MTTNRHDEIVKLIETGATYAKVGQQLGITKQRVEQILHPKSRKANLQSKGMLTTRDVAHLLGIHNTTVRRWSKTGILKSYRIGSRRDRRFKHEDIDDFLQETKSTADLSERTLMPFSRRGLRTRVFELYDPKYANVYELAQAMGISEAQAYRVRRGDRGINEQFITGAMRAFPGYKLDDLFYVVEGGIVSD